MAGMGHDLKSPLTSIRAYTEALLEGVGRGKAYGMGLLTVMRP